MWAGVSILSTQKTEVNIVLIKVDSQSPLYNAVHRVWQNHLAQSVKTRETANFTYSRKIQLLTCEDMSGLYIVSC